MLIQSTLPWTNPAPGSLLRLVLVVRCGLAAAGLSGERRCGLRFIRGLGVEITRQAEPRHGIFHVSEYHDLLHFVDFPPGGEHAGQAMLQFGGHDKGYPGAGAKDALACKVFNLGAASLGPQRKGAGRVVEISSII